MANLTAAEVTVVRSWSEGGAKGKDRIGMLVRMENTSAGIACGGTTNLMPASAFGLRKVESCGNLLVYTTSSGVSVKMYPMVPSYDGVVINSCLAADGTQANHINVGDVGISTSQRGLMEVHGYK